MGAPERKLAFQKSTGSWVIVAPAGDGYEVAETLDPEDASNWTGEAYDLASAHPKASAELKPKLDWYRDNMLNEPTGPLDENGKTTATPQPGLVPANDNATTAPANDNAAPPVRPSPVAEDDKPSSVWGALARSGKSFLTDLGNAGAATFGDGPLVQEPPAWLRSDDTVDAMRGAAQGFTRRGADELAAEAESRDAMLFGGDDIPSAQRRSGRSFDAPLMTDDERREAYSRESLASTRADNATSQERSPWLYGGSEAVATLPAAIATAPLFGTSGAAAQVPWKTLAMRSAGQGAVEGAITGAGGGTEGNRLSSSAIGAGTGAAGGFAGSAIGSGVAAGAQWTGRKAGDALNAMKDAVPRAAPGEVVDDAGQGIVRRASNWAGNLANRSRAAAVADGGTLRALSDKEGFDFVDDEFGAAVEQMFPPETAMGIPVPRTTRGYASLAIPKAEEIGEGIGRSVKEMDAQGVSAPVRPYDGPLDIADEAREVALVDPIDREIGKIGRMQIGDDDKVLRSALRSKRMQALKAAGENERLNATQLHAMKRSLAGSGYAPSSLKGLPAGMRREANRVASAGPREALNDAASKQALPETLETYNRLNEQFPTAKMVADAASGKAAREQGNQIASMPGAVGTIASGGPGAMLAAGWEVAKRYGADAAANGFRGAQRATQLKYGPAPAPSPALQQVTQAAGARAGVPWGSLVRQGQPAMAQPPAQRVEIGEAQITSRPQQRAATSNGHELQRHVQNALKAYPQALGPFKEQLLAVEQDPVALSAAISDLMNDPRFRDEIVPELQAVPNGGRQIPGAR